MLFNQDTSYYAELDEMFNRIFVREQEDYLNTVLKARGYVYLNQIYEVLGFAWDPKQENKCYIYEQGDQIDFGTVSTRNGLELMYI